MNEQHRPQIHFSPQANWMNDPNGLIYSNDTYHLFFQYYPEDIVWGPMHWGHATSKDLVHWEEQDIALYPDRLGYIFSGSAVMDHENRTGLGSMENPPMVAIFTHHEPEIRKAGGTGYEKQSIAYSLDQGKTWTKYRNNPVLDVSGSTDFRDPKVGWFEPEQKWVMALAAKDRVQFYSSPNLIDWTFESEFGQNRGAHGGVWECPDLFPLTDTDGNQKWVLLVSINPGGIHGGSATQYFIGDFDGQHFIPDDEHLRWLDYGADNYAGVTFSNIPEADGRRIFVGWMSNWDYATRVPTKKWRSAMTLPRELHLFKDKNGKLQVQSKPIAALKSLKNKSISISEANNKQIAPPYLLHFKYPGDNPVILQFENELGQAAILEVDHERLRFDRSNSGATSFASSFGKVHTIPLSDIALESVTIYIDRASFEIFINEGEKVITEIVFPTEAYSKINVLSESINPTITPLNPIWKPISADVK